MTLYVGPLSTPIKISIAKFRTIVILLEGLRACIKRLICFKAFNIFKIAKFKTLGHSRSDFYEFFMTLFFGPLKLP